MLGSALYSPATATRMLHAGLIGLPSTGKTTLFHLLTQPHKGASKGRSATSVAIASVPDPRLDRLMELFPHSKRVPATVTFADVAGHARSRSLLDVAPFREADALLHVVRAFRAEQVPHPSGSIDPERDARAMEDELILADLAAAERRLERIERDQRKGGASALNSERQVLEECRHALEKGTPLRALTLEPAATKLLRGFQLLSAKPLLLIINLDEADVEKSDRSIELPSLMEVQPRAATREVSVCAKIELEIADLKPDDAAAFRANLGFREPGLDRVILAAYELLGYITFFTIGKDECRAWSIAEGTIAQVAAGEIHSDIKRGFIRAEVVDYNHLVARSSLSACRRHGEVRLEGKKYVVRDGDVIDFRFAT